MNYQTISVEKKDGVLTIALNRPDVNNALNTPLVTELHHAFTTVALEDSIRAVLLKGNGKVFCAGGDITMMQKSLKNTHQQNFEWARQFSILLEKINELPKPVMAVAHGAVFGGGLGLLSVCDYVLALEETLFSFSEVRIGLIPACIAPFVMVKIGESQTRALVLSAERFDSQKALRIGLIHRIEKGGEALEQATEKLIKDLISSSPQALRIAKKFIHELREKNCAEKHIYAAQTLADLQVTPEAQEGLTAFLEKRSPRWNKN
ncbi:MAG: hypothetical protein A3F89_06485 [Deltaproteobacteria bacterium RIFCSPLOWO2_12_FULL_50_11]|nr:MAG: hypothetical protein A3B79_07395 [Deltaproteobacteria bacterium RIFCSPHIGHO2_02_FULL_50_15]OGQ67346.1 MAG: hypothetical protein A3F89_06485 [Deltaproteobacteria bacterium RIFCSPLOWO2_12_FULL_50_11]